MDALKHFGLTGYEIKIYLSLLRQGNSSAKEISSFSGVPPTAVYPNIKSLVEKGLVKSFSGDVTRFEVVTPSVALKHLAKKKSDELFSIERSLSPQLNNLKNDRIVKPPDPVELSRGSQASLDLSFRLIDDASKSLYIIGWGFRKVKALHRAIKLFKALGDKNIDARVIFGSRNERTEYLAKECERFGVKARYYDLNNFSMVLSDANECKITLKRSELTERVNIHIIDKHLVDAFNNYALMLWERSHDF